MRQNTLRHAMVWSSAALLLVACSDPSTPEPTTEPPSESLTLSPDATPTPTFAPGVSPTVEPTATPRPEPTPTPTSTAVPVTPTPSAPPTPMDADDDGILANEDCDDLNGDVGGPTTWYPDTDGDGYGDSSSAPTLACEAPASMVANSADCNDSAANSHPQAPERCDGADADCNGLVLHAGQAAFVAQDGTYTDLSHLAQGTLSSPASYSTPADGTFYICSGLWYVNLTLAHNVALIGPDGSAQTLLDGSDHGSVVAVNSPQGQINVSLTGLTLRNGTAANGGGLYVKNGLVKASDVDIVGNFASATGGGVFVGALSSLDIVGSQIRDNAAEKEGGGVYCTGGEVHLQHSSLSSNEAWEDYTDYQGGGAILMVDGALYLDTVNFSGNESWRAGGAISLVSSQLEVSASTFDNNKAYNGSGGAIRGSSGSSIVVDGSEFLLNTASSYGGALHAEVGSSLTVADSLVDQNHARYGGGISALDAPPVVLQAVTFTSNIADDSGGAYYSSMTRTAGSDLIINGNHANEDYSPYGGAGIYCSGETVTLLDSRIETNATIGYGGGIYLSSCDLSMTGGAIADNAAEYGAGIYAGAASVVTLVGSQVSLNTASSYGGGIHVVGGSTLTTSGDVRVEENVSKTYGGGIYANDHVDLTLTETVFKSNQAHRSGGGIYVNQGTVTGTAVSFEGNKSLYYTSYPNLNDGGGGLVAESSTVTLTDVDLKENDSKLYGGGAIFNATTITWSDSTLTLNTAGLDGAGALFTGNSKVALTGLSVTENVASDDGGGLDFVGNSSKATVTNCDIQGNSAVDADGGIIVDRSWVKITGGTIQTNRAAKGGGGIGAYGLSAALYLDVSGTCFSGNKTNQVYNATTAKAYEAGCPATFSCDNLGCQ